MQTLKPKTKSFLTVEEEIWVASSIVPQIIQRIFPKKQAQALRGYIQKVAFYSVEYRLVMGSRDLWLPSVECVKHKRLRS